MSQHSGELLCLRKHRRADVPRGPGLPDVYGHVWMKPWQGYEPSERLKAAATTPVCKQLLHAVPPYGSSLRH